MNLCWEPFGKLLSQPENPANPVQALGKRMDWSCDVGSFPSARGWWMEGERLESIASPAAPGGISWGVVGGLLHAGQTKVHPTEELISGGGQKQVPRNVKEQGGHPTLPPSFLVDLPTSPVPHVISGLSPAKFQQSSSGQDQTQVKFIHLTASEELQAV